MTPLVAVLHYHLGKRALRAQPGSWTAGNSLSSCASVSAHPRISCDADSWKASLVAFPTLCHRLHVGRERQWFVLPYEKHLLGSQCQPWQLGTMYDKMETAACNCLYVLIGHLTGLCDLACPFQTVSFKNCISIKVTCLALALSVKSHPSITIHVSLPSLGVIATLWLKRLPLWNWGGGIFLNHYLKTVWSIFSHFLGKKSSQAQKLQRIPAPLPSLPAQRHGQKYLEKEPASKLLLTSPFLQHWDWEG